MPCRLTPACRCRGGPRWLLLLCATSALSAGPTRPLARFGLLDAAFGPTSEFITRSGEPYAVLPVKLLELGYGVRSGDHLGFAVGTALYEGDFVGTLSLLPLHGYLFYDIAPGRTGRGAMGYLSVAYDWCAQDGWSGSQLGSGFRLTGGVSYTYYAVTPHADIGYDTRRNLASLTAGLALGGTYVFE